MVKNLFFATMFLLMGFAGLESEAFANEDSYAYRDYEDGVEITRYNGSETDLVIPGELSGKKVIRIGDSAFSSSDLASVEIPDSVVELGYSSFQNNNLSSVEIGNGVTSIGSNAFQNNRLTSVKIPNSVEVIEIASFADNELAGVEIGSGVKEIRDNAFQYNQLQNVVIPNSVEVVGGNSFYRNELTNVELGKSVSFIGDGAFSYNKLIKIEIPEKVSIVEDNTLSYNNLTSVTLHNNITSIGSMAFSGNELTNIEIPDSVKSIGSWAFLGNKLTNLTLSENVESIGELAFVLNKLEYVNILNEDLIFCENECDNVFRSEIIEGSITEEMIVGGYGINENLILRGYEGSTTEAYASKASINHPFEVIKRELSVKIKSDSNISTSLKLGEESALKFSDSKISLIVEDTRDVDDTYHIKVTLNEFTHEDGKSILGIGDEVMLSKSYDPKNPDNLNFTERIELKDLKLDDSKFIKAGKYNSKLIVEVVESPKK